MSRSRGRATTCSSRIRWRCTIRGAAATTRSTRCRGSSTGACGPRCSASSSRRRHRAKHQPTRRRRSSRPLTFAPRCAHDSADDDRLPEPAGRAGRHSVQRAPRTQRGIPAVRRDPRAGVALRDAASRVSQAGLRLVGCRVVVLRGSAGGDREFPDDARVDRAVLAPGTHGLDRAGGARDGHGVRAGKRALAVLRARRGLPSPVVVHRDLPPRHLRAGGAPRRALPVGRNPRDRRRLLSLRAAGALGRRQRAGRGVPPLGPPSPRLHVPSRSGVRGFHGVTTSTSSSNWRLARGSCCWWRTTCAAAWTP